MHNLTEPRRPISELTPESGRVLGENRVPWDAQSIVRALWTHRFLVAIGALVGGMLFAALSFLPEPRYRSTARFIVQAGGDIQVPAALQGLVAQLGVGVPAAQSPDFYVALANQPTIALAVMRDTFTVPDSVPSLSTLMTVVGLDTTNMAPTELEEEALKSYHDRTQARVNSRTGIVEIAFEAPDPHVAASVANRIVGRLAQFDIALRRTSGSNTRIFLDQRVSEAEQEIGRANQSLESFLATNRDFANSPRLSIAYDRLRREASRLEAQHEQLVLQRDRARIDEISSIPALSIVDSAAAPFRRAAPKRRLWAFAGFVFGAMVFSGAIVLSMLGHREGRGMFTSARLGLVVLIERIGARL
jgi:uncharacterized protein involved in exopolysaccharide biosynthesis